MLVDSLALPVQPFILNNLVFLFWVLSDEVHPSARVMRKPASLVPIKVYDLMQSDCSYPIDWRWWRLGSKNVQLILSPVSQLDNADLEFFVMKPDAEYPGYATVGWFVYELFIQYDCLTVARLNIVVPISSIVTFNCTGTRRDLPLFDWLLIYPRYLTVDKVGLRPHLLGLSLFSPIQVRRQQDSSTPPPQLLQMSSWTLLWYHKLIIFPRLSTHFPQGSITLELYNNHASKMPPRYTCSIRLPQNSNLLSSYNVTLTYSSPDLNQLLHLRLMRLLQQRHLPSHYFQLHTPDR